MEKVKLNVTQPDGAHRVTVTMEEENLYLVCCQECGRIFCLSPERKQVLVKGDFLANHSFATTPVGWDLVLDMTLGVRSETDDKLAHLLDDVSIDFDE